ncbi:MAG: hypothetical protein ACJAUG_003250, partial [Halioglobus sp.]
ETPKLSYLFAVDLDADPGRKLAVARRALFQTDHRRNLTRDPGEAATPREAHQPSALLTSRPTVL